MNESVRVNTPIFHSVTELNNGLGVFEGIKKIQWGEGVGLFAFSASLGWSFYTVATRRILCSAFFTFCMCFFPLYRGFCHCFFLSTYLSRSLRFAYFLIFREKWRIMGSKETSSFLPLIPRLFIPPPFFFKLSIQLPRRNVFSFYLLLLNIIIRKMRSVRAMVFQKPGLPYFFHPPSLHFFFLFLYRCC